MMCDEMSCFFLLLLLLVVELCDDFITGIIAW